MNESALTRPFGLTSLLWWLSAEAEGWDNRDQGLSQRIQLPPAYIKISQALLHIEFNSIDCGQRSKRPITASLNMMNEKVPAHLFCEAQKAALAAISSHMGWNSCLFTDECGAHRNARSGLS